MLRRIGVVDHSNGVLNCNDILFIRNTTIHPIHILTLTSETDVRAQQMGRAHVVHTSCTRACTQGRAHT